MHNTDLVLLRWPNFWILAKQVKMSWQMVTRETEAACQTGANGKEQNIVDTVGIEAFLYASIKPECCAHIQQVAQQLLLQWPLWHNARMHHQHAMAGNAEAERHVLEVCHVLSCKVLQVAAKLRLHSNNTTDIPCCLNVCRRLPFTADAALHVKFCCGGRCRAILLLTSSVPVVFQEWYLSSAISS